MPRKRTRASAQTDVKQNKFHCEEAKVRCESILKNQQMHPGKGFTLKESNYTNFMARIRQVAEALNWELFSEKRPILGSKWTVSKQGIHTCRREYLTPLAKQQVEERKDPEEEQDDPTEIEPEQSTEVLDEVEPMEPEPEPDTETSMFRTQPPSPDLRDELSKLMDIMQHMQWQQQAY
ncbi:hypothetical protein J1N35_013957 [Gossypium stocksii]|uniref:Uncharacterized protein n=1 Tax=Gossypium stocksii TaxID=47602 RepID=A0A9D3VVP4_9ROSI|nr:hypothetical protein J1N35_013957 [Gossypium stocksii]